MRRFRFMLVLTMFIFALDLVPLTVGWWFGGSDSNIDNMIRAMQFIFTGFLSIVLGLLASARHPANSAAYRNWLIASPWRAGLPLPMGSVTPRLAEYGLLAVYVAMVTLHLHTRFEVPLIGFMLGFSIPTLLTLARTGPAPAAIAMVLVAALIPRFVPDLTVILIVSAALYVIACAAAERSLRKFPWGMDEVKFPKHKLGAVFDRLSPKTPERSITTRSGVITAAAIGCWLYCILAQPLDGIEAPPPVYVMPGLVASFMALMRFALYCGEYNWPISLRGRIRTGKLIIPGYDYVMIAPLCAALMGWTMPTLAIGAGATPAAALGLTMSLVMLVLLLGPPSLGHWQLTGNHRVVLTPSPKDRQKPQPPTTINLFQTR